MSEEKTSIGFGLGLIAGVVGGIVAGVLLAPKDENHAKFNAGMVKQGDKVHMVYRWSKQNGIATDANEKKTGIVYLDDFVSYAELTPEGKLVSDLDEQGLIKYYIENPKTPVYAQDPRIVEFEGEYIIFFVSYDLKICRVGMARTKDFKKIEPIGIIPSNDWDKDAFILPERINGKIVYIHRIEPNIQIDYFDSFDEMIDPEYWNHYNEKIHEQVVMKSEYPWENRKIGGSVPPIKTPEGWLFIYHGVADDREPFCYRAGAALLDLENPSKVIARLPYPILEPTEDYEVAGDVPNVVFPVGAYIHEGYVYISYGGADKVVALCRFKYDELMEEFRKNPIK